MIQIEWKGKIGYGDIISPICYAHNISSKLRTKVELNFRWNEDSFHKIYDTDPETLWFRADYLNSLCEKRNTDVTVYHRFKSPLEINHTNYDWDTVGSDPLHNYWFVKEKFKNTKQSNLIVFNTTLQNKQTLKQYGKSWKDPIADKWNSLLQEAKRTHDVVDVNYSTRIQDMVSMMRGCKLFIGYHGTAAWVARLLEVPSIIFSGGGKLTSSSFPQASVLTDLQDPDNFLDSIDSYEKQQRSKIDEIRTLYHSYVIPEKHRESLKFK